MPCGTERLAGADRSSRFNSPYLVTTAGVEPAHCRLGNDGSVRLSYVAALQAGFEPAYCALRRRVPIHSSHWSNWSCGRESNTRHRLCRPAHGHSVTATYWHPLRESNPLSARSERAVLPLNETGNWSGCGVPPTVLRLPRPGLFYTSFTLLGLREGFEPPTFGFVNRRSYSAELPEDHWRDDGATIPGFQLERLASWSD
jgi:hypothetical protein